MTKFLPSRMIDTMTAELVDSRTANERISATARSLMGYHGLTVKQLAEKSGIDEDTLGRRLRVVGKHGWLAAEVIALARALDADVTLFTDGLPDGWFRRRQIDGTQLTRPKVKLPSQRGRSGHHDVTRTAVTTSVAA